MEKSQYSFAKIKVRNIQMRKLLALVLLCTACGGPMIEPGIWEVDKTFITNEVNRYLEGETETVFWRIEEHEGTYKLGPRLDNGTIGKEKANCVVFQTEIIDSCGSLMYTMKLCPKKDTNKKADGTSDGTKTYTKLCNYGVIESFRVVTELKAKHTRDL
jgi:hypothetical protein